jgi:hypothetical protein
MLNTGFDPHKTNLKLKTATARTSLRDFTIIANWKVQKMQFREGKFPIESNPPYIRGYIHLVLL